MSGLKTLKSLKQSRSYTEGVEDLLNAKNMIYHTSDDWKEKKPTEFVVVIDDKDTLLVIDDLYKNIEDLIRSASSKLFLAGTIGKDDVSIIINKNKLRELAVNPHSPVDIQLLWNGDTIDTTLRVTKSVVESYVLSVRLLTEAAKKPKQTPEEIIKTSKEEMNKLTAQLNSGKDEKGNVLTYEAKEKLKKSIEGKEDAIYKAAVNKYKAENPNATDDEITAGIKAANPGMDNLFDKASTRAKIKADKDAAKKDKKELEKLNKQLETGKDPKGNELTDEQKAALRKSIDEKEDSIYSHLAAAYKAEHPDVKDEDVLDGVKKENSDLDELLDRAHGRKLATNTNTNTTNSGEEGGEESGEEGGGKKDVVINPVSNYTPPQKNANTKGSRSATKDIAGMYGDMMKTIENVKKGEGSALSVAFAITAFLVCKGFELTANGIKKAKDDKAALDARLGDARLSFAKATDGELKADPMSEDVMSIFYDADGNPRSSDDLQKSLGSVDPETMDKYVAAATAYAKSKDFAKTREYMDAVSKLDPKDKAELDAYGIDQAKLKMSNSKLAQQTALIDEMKKEIAKVEKAGNATDASYLKALKHDLKNQEAQRDKTTKDIQTHKDSIAKRQEAITRIANANKDTIPALEPYSKAVATPVALDKALKDLQAKLEKGVNGTGAPLTDEEKAALQKEIDTAEDDLRNKAVEIFKKDNPDFTGTEAEMLDKIKEANKDNKTITAALENSVKRNPPKGAGGGEPGEPGSAPAGGGDDEITKMKDEWKALNDQLKSGKDKDGNDLTDEQKAQLEKDADDLQDKVIDTLTANYKKDHPDATEEEVQKEIRKQHPDIVPKQVEVTAKNGEKTAVQHKLGPRGGKYYRTKGPNATKWSQWQSGDYTKCV